MTWSEAKSPLYEDVQLGKPGLRVWELNENSTGYDRQRAAPSDETMQKVWIAWSTFFFAFAIFNIIVFLGIVTARKVRSRPFNVYVIFLMIPDIIYTFSCAIQCAFLAARNGFVSPGVCQLQSFYLMFGLTANSYMNALVARELKRLLTSSSRRARYKPPTTKKIAWDSCVVYLFSAGISMASWVVNVPWWPHRTDLQNGLVCLPISFDKASTIVFWVAFFPIMSGFPLLYCFYVVWDVWRKQLLPPPGKRRELMIYFYRITGVFAVMWVPGVFFFYASAVLPKVNVWAIYVASVWSHSQGAVAAAVSMMKEDVYGAVMNLVWCRGKWDDPFLSRRRISVRVSGNPLRRTGSSAIDAHATSLSTMPDIRVMSQDLTSDDLQLDGEDDDDYSQGSYDSEADATPEKETVDGEFDNDDSGPSSQSVDVEQPIQQVEAPKTVRIDFTGTLNQED